ncbi:hypothetical protein [Marinitenerispora sediminis]|uniref:Uncharacterized protein n=1 Tax=Marinitenerispora sediminis TaxID=1931232 RepID=A0A368T8Y3_9ACTN|nr:hypothetical protein [Marinitenerispora sediminis]RCV54310.1 hypothetical protein DEF28_08490 [Marinitenerispora sediminis]RCV60517.1 hypothetical protein DEF24_06975 [Marinitenerispora sediminis]RCV61069.1 hypothetical protein DEF23_03405 [Marinitenerispora sediminis]
MFRHPLGLLAGIMVTPLLWAGTGWAASELVPLLSGRNYGEPMLLTAVAVLMAVGVLVGLLAGSRISPLAAFVSGGAILAVSVWPLVDFASMNRLVPDVLAAGTMLHPLGPALPVNVVVGTLLFISALMPSRWRSRRRAEEPVPAPRPVAAGGAEPPAQRAAPVYPDPVLDEPAKTTTPFRRTGGRIEPEPWTEEPGAAPGTRVFGDGDSR